MKTDVQGYWLGHSAFRFVTTGGKRIYVDPFLSQNPKTPEGEKNPDQIDYILLTHGHEDHTGDTIELAKKTGATVLSIVELAGNLKSKGLPENQAVDMNKGGTLSFDEFRVTMTSANHSSSFGGDYVGDPAGLILHFDDVTVYHAGDTNIMWDFQLYKEIYNPQVCILPIGGYYTMGPREAAHAVRLLEPSYVVPCHYGTFPVLTGTPEDLKSNMKSIGVDDPEVLAPEPGEKFMG